MIFFGAWLGFVAQCLLDSYGSVGAMSGDSLGDEMGAVAWLNEYTTLHILVFGINSYIYKHYSAIG